VAPLLVVSCLGPPIVVTAAGEPVRFRTRKHLALLVRLAVEPGRKLTRDYLTDLLWPNAPGRLASHSLAQALSVIRLKVGRAQILVQRASVALAEGAVDVDTQHLEDCEAAIRGAFLEGFELPAARPFEDWKDEWRAKLLPRMRDALVRQMDAGRRIGDFAAVERHAQVLHDLDPLSEDAVRGKIEARAWVGDRSNALKAYAAYESRLAEELGAKPSAELDRMATLLREGRRSPGARPRGVAERVERVERRFEPETLIGREREFSVLYDAWLAARRRTPGIVVLTGDPGLGKTTLANAFLSTCQLEGAVVARAQAYDAERELPFAVLAELVRQLAVQRAIGGAEPDALSELSRLTPEVCAQFPGVPKPVEWAAEIVPLRLADAFLKTVTAAAEESPVVLVVDDVHAADNASAAILHVVARKLPPTRLLLILAARSTELRASGAPAALTSDSTIENLRPLDLESLPDEAATRLVERVRAVAAAAGDGDLPLERILRAGRGNPLALELLTREWVTHGPESLLRDLEAMNTQPAAALGIPRAIKVVFERQVARLDAKTRAVLDLAAVLGRRLTELTLYEAVDCTPAEAAEGLGRLRDEGFVREVRGDIEFRNELIRGQAYYDIPAPGRQHMHRKVAELLEEHHDQDLDHHALEIAWHHFRGASGVNATLFGLRGAKVSLSVGAPHEAERILKVLLSSTDCEPSRKDLQLLLGRAFLDQSQASSAAPLIECLRAGHHSLSKREKAELSRMRASTEYLLNRESDLRYTNAARCAVEDAIESGDPELIAQALFELARAGVTSGDIPELHEAANRITAALDDPDMRQEPMLHYTKAYCQFFGCDITGSARSLEQALQLLAARPKPVETSLAYTGYGVCKRALGEINEAVRLTRCAFDLSTKIGDDTRASILAGNVSAMETDRGNLAEAIEWGLKSLELGRRASNPPYLVASYLSLAEAYILSNQTDKALHYWELAKEHSQTSQAWSERLIYYVEAAGLALTLGNVPLALTLIEKVDESGNRGEHMLGDPGVYDKFRVFRAAHLHGFDTARKIVEVAEERLRDRHVLSFLSVAAARAWLEKRFVGRYSTETERNLELFSELGFSGRRALLRAQGFLD
jgi:DNA-binding SARP family transcriptional activator/tetratricopeptide (TPR) repeat protein